MTPARFRVRLARLISRAAEPLFFTPPSRTRASEHEQMASLRTIRLLGVEVFHASTDKDEQQQSSEHGDCTTYPIGFTASPGDQRWENPIREE